VQMRSECFYSAVMANSKLVYSKETWRGGLDTVFSGPYQAFSILFLCRIDTKITSAIRNGSKLLYCLSQGGRYFHGNNKPKH